MSNTKNSKSSRIAVDTHLIAGLTKHAHDLPPSITLAGQAHTPVEWVTVLQGRIDSANAVITAKASSQAAVLADRQERAQTNPYVTDLKAWLQVTYSNSPEMLADYGLSPRKKATKKSAAKVVAAAKADATRLARHTMGSKEKAKIKGTLTGPVVVEPSPEPAAPPAGATPAAAPSASGTGPSGAAPAGTAPAPKP